LSERARSVVLASGSPRRATLLEKAGYRIRVEPAHVSEHWPGDDRPESTVIGLATRKAEAVRRRFPDATVLGADTEVFLAGHRVGKPASREEAARMLGELSGREHEVWTGVALVVDGRRYTAADSALVRFRPLTEREIGTYLQHADYSDKAGAYGIQEEGRDLVVAYSGRLDTIIGLSMNIVETLWSRWEAQTA